MKRTVTARTICSAITNAKFTLPEEAAMIAAESAPEYRTDGEWHE
jgi:hypothetical protein